MRDKPRGTVRLAAVASLVLVVSLLTVFLLTRDSGRKGAQELGVVGGGDSRKEQERYPIHDGEPESLGIGTQAPGFAGSRLSDGETPSEDESRADGGGSELSILVVDREGRPVSGAQIELWKRYEDAARADSSPVSAWYAGDDGSATFRAPRDSEIITVSHPVFGTSGAFSAPEAQRFLSGGRPMLVRLLPQSTIQGTVVRIGGGPVPFAVINLEPAVGPRNGRGASVLPENVLTDVNGAFELQFDTLEKLYLSATAPEAGGITGQLPESDAYSLYPVPGERETVILDLPPDWSVAGIVTELSGKRVPFASVWYQERPTGGSDGITPSQVQADGEGQFSVYLHTSGHYDFLATAEGFSISDIQSVEIPEYSYKADLNIGIGQAGVILGTVEDVEGARLGQVDVFARPFSSEADHPLLAAVATLVTAVTNSEGEFELGPTIPRLEYRLIASRPGEFARWEDGIDVWGDAKDVEFTISGRAANGELRGVVVDAHTGAPMAEVSIDLVIRVDQADAAREITRLDVSQTSDDGSFEIKGVPWDELVAVSCRAEGYGLARSAWIRLSDEDESLHLELFALGSIRASIATSAAAGTLLELRIWKRDSGEQAPPHTPIRTVRVGGPHLLAGLDPGEYWLEGRLLEHEWSEPARVIVRPGLESGATIHLSEE